MGSEGTVIVTIIIDTTREGMMLATFLIGRYKVGHTKVI